MFGNNSKIDYKINDFKGTIKKLLTFIKPYKLFFILALLLSVVGVFSSIMTPNILGDVSDEIITNVVQKQIYREMKPVRDKYQLLINNMELINYEAAMSISDDITINKAIDIGLLKKESLDLFDDNEKALISSMSIYLFKDIEYPNGINNVKEINDLFIKLYTKDMLGKQISSSYSDKILKMSLNYEPINNYDNIFKLLIIISTIVLISMLCSIIEGLIMSKVGVKIAYKLRDDISKKINKMPLKYFDKTNNGEILSLVVNDVDALTSSLAQSLTEMISNITLIIGTFVMMVRIKFTLALITLLLVPFSLIIIAIFIKKSQKFFTKYRKGLSDINSQIEETYAGVKVIKLFNIESKNINEVKRLNNELYKSTWKSSFISGIIYPVMGFMGNIGFVVACFLGGKYAIAGTMTIGSVQAFIQYAKTFNRPITQIGQLTGTFQQIVAAAERIFKFLEEENEIDVIDDKIVVKEFNGKVEFKNVSFGYDTNKIIINNFSQTIKPGTKIAIVGPTGAGKTTIVKLLMNFYELNGGHILIDDIDVDSLSKHNVRDCMGMVLQDTWLFEGTVFDNIKYGRNNATKEDVYKAADLACADHFIKALPDGYNFKINEDTSNISSGEKQLLTIARTILKDPKILILDEATSSVDTRTEILIQKAMDNLMKNKTSFVIAHRLSTIKESDLILVMDHGDIIEVGNHEDLLAKNGFYTNLYNSQFER